MTTTQQTSGTFEAHGRTWEWGWVDAGLSVLHRDEPDLNEEGIDYTEWPTEEEISAQVGCKVVLVDAINEGESECLYRQVEV